MLAVTVLACSVIFHTIPCALTVPFSANEGNNSYVSLSWEFRPRIIYGHTMCFSYMQAVPLCCRKVNLRVKGLLGVYSPCKAPSVQPVLVPGMAERPEQSERVSQVITPSVPRAVSGICQQQASYLQQFRVTVSRVALLLFSALCSSLLPLPQWGGQSHLNSLRRATSTVSKGEEFQLWEAFGIPLPVLIHWNAVYSIYNLFYFFPAV